MPQGHRRSFPVDQNPKSPNPSVPAGLEDELTQESVVRTARRVLGYFLTSCIMIFLAKKLPIDPRISVSVTAIILTVWFLRKRSSRQFAVSIFFANYLAAVQFYAWGQLYPVIAAICLFFYMSGRRNSARLPMKWRAFLFIWVFGAMLSALHSVIVLKADLATQLVGIQEYIGVACAIVLAYKSAHDPEGGNQALISIGVMGLLTGILAWLAVFHPTLAQKILPGVGKLVYGAPGITPFGQMPKLTVEVTGVTLVSFLSGAVGLSLWCYRRIAWWFGAVIMASGALASFLIYRRSIVVGFLLTVSVVLWYFFGKVRKRNMAYLAIVFLVMTAAVSGRGFFESHFGQKYWNPYGATKLKESVEKDRSKIWSAAWEDVRRHPWLGVGPNFYIDMEKEPVEYGPTNAHNVFLYYLRTLGVPVGILSSLVFLSVCWGAVLECMKVTGNRKGIFQVSVQGAFFAGLLFFSMFGDIQRMANPHMLVWSLIGLRVGLVHARGFHTRMRIRRSANLVVP